MHIFNTYLLGKTTREILQFIGEAGRLLLLYNTISGLARCIHRFTLLTGPCDYVTHTCS